jgi:ureidoacrylate peracid hydrolase
MNKKVLVVIDIQKEYTTPGRRFYLEHAGPSLRKAKEVLESARGRKWPVIHVKHLQAGDIFNRESAFSDYVEEFRPLSGEHEIVKSNFSCYSSPEFAELAARYKESELVVIGYGSTMCCLSTIVDGYHRGQSLVFVRDASSAKRTASLDEPATHRAATEILSIYSKVVDSEELLKTPAAG